MRRLCLIELLHLGLAMQRSNQQVGFTQTCVIECFNYGANLKHSEKTSFNQRASNQTHKTTLNQTVLNRVPPFQKNQNIAMPVKLNCASTIYDDVMQSTDSLSQLQQTSFATLPLVLRQCLKVMF